MMKISKYRAAILSSVAAITLMGQAASATPASNSNSESADAPTNGVQLAQNTSAAQQAPAAAEVDRSSGVEEIVVTAQRRTERLQDVPIAITAISADRLKAVRTEAGVDLPTVTPGLTVSYSQTTFQPRIRGVGTLAFGPGIENPIATYVDGVYLASVNASMMNLTDVARVEVLKGPQGTLFGRNATGGLLQIITQDPTPGFGGTADFSYGNYQRIGVNASMHGGSETVSGIITGFMRHQNKGFGTNLATGNDTNRLENEQGVRAKLVLKPTEQTTIKIAGDYVHTDGSYPDPRAPKGEKTVFEAAPIPGSVFDTNNDLERRIRYSGGGASLHVDQELGPVRLVSISAYRRFVLSSRFDFDQSPAPLATVAGRQIEKQFTQEIQLGSMSDSPIQWLVGAYYFRARGANPDTAISFGGPLAATIQQILIDGFAKTRSYAGFGQVTIPIGDNTRITGGLRYTSERRTLDDVQGVKLAALPAPIFQTFAGKARFNKLTFRAAIDHKLTPDVLMYASFNRGFKSGGFNILTPDQPAFKPETLDAYEGGFKAEFLDRRVRINPAIFYYNYENIQLPFFTDTGQVGLNNGPKAKLWGLDFDFEVVPTANLRIFGGGSYIHDRFGFYPDAVINVPLGSSGAYSQIKGDATGNHLPFTSKWSGNIGGEYSVPMASGTLKLSGNLFLSDGYAFEVDNIARQDAYELLSSSLTWESEDKRFSVSVWGKNLTDERVITQYATRTTGVAALWQFPRTYGVTLGTKF